MTEWGAKELEALVLLHDSGTWGQPATPSDGLPVLRSTNIQDWELTLETDVAYRSVSERDKQTRKLERGDIIVTKSSGSPHLIGEAALFDIDDAESSYLFSNFTLRLRPNPEIILPRYLHYYLRSPTARQVIAEMHRTTSGLRNLQMADYLSQNVVLPFPDEPERSLEIQRRIVVRMEALLAEVWEMRNLHKEITVDVDELLQSVRREVFGTQPGSDWVPLNSYVRFIENGRSPQAQNRSAQGQEWGVLKVGAVTYGYFKYDENKALLPGTEPRTEFEVRQGDFLMSRANTLALVGACALVKEIPPPRLLLSDKIFRFHFRDDAMLNLVYLDHVLKSPALRAQIERVASGTSPTMKNISKQKVMNLLIPKYSYNEQERIASYFALISDEVEEMRNINQEDGNLLSEIEQAILAQAFRGEL